MNKRFIALSCLAIGCVLLLAGCNRDEPGTSRGVGRPVKGGFKESSAALTECTTLQENLDRAIRLHQAPLVEGGSMFDDLEKEGALKEIIAAANKLSEVANSYVKAKYQDESAEENIQKMRELAEYADLTLARYKVPRQ